jgi:chemotaxis protein CheY-P-specific phosphatase CheC
MQNKFSKKLGIFIIALLTVTTISAAIPFASATITSRPTVYDSTGATAAPIEIEAGTTASIDTNGMTITGAQIWLWLSTTGGSEINTALGDRPYAGPFLLSELVDTVTPHTYTFTPTQIAALCGLLSVDSPFAGEQKTYTYTIGNGWINGTIPLKVQGEDVDYWLKIADVTPSDTIAGSEIGVSQNRVHFLPGFFAAPLMGAPETTVTVSGYALPSTSEYNVTEDGTTRLALLTGTEHSEGGWNWTGFSNAFNVMDLAAKVPYTSSPPQSTNLNITVWENDTVALMDTWNFTQYWREVYLEDEFSSLTFRGDAGDYSAMVTLNTGGDYDLEMEYFPAFGTASVYLGNVLVTSGVALNGTGGTLTSITIPALTTGDYILCVKDSNLVTYNFTVHVVMVPYITCTPDMGYVGDAFAVTGVNFLDYVGQYVTLYFENSWGGGYVLLWNETITTSTWTTEALTVPMSWGGARRVEARITDGTSLIAFDIYTVLTQINVIPDEINNTVCQTVMVEGTGFYYDTDDVEGWLVFIDNEQYFGYWDFFHLGINSTGYVMFNFAAAGFRPGLHVVSVIPESYGALPMTIAAKDNFWVTYEGDLIKMNLDAYLESINVTVTAIWDGMASLETAMGEVTVTLAELDATIMEVDGNIATLSTSIGTIQTTLTSLNSKVTSISNDIANIDTDLGPVMTKLDSIDAVIGAMYGDVVTINTTIGTFETTLDALDATITSVESTVGDIDDVTGLIAGDVIEIQTTLGTITGNITDIQDSIATIETDLGTVKVDLATAKTDIAAVETDVNDNLPVDMLPVWIAVVLALIAAIGSIAGVFIIQRKIA